MFIRPLLTALVLLATPLGTNAQQLPLAVDGPSAAADAAEFDTSYRHSPSISARMQREFLSRIRWSVGPEVRDSLVEAFKERSPNEIWQELVAPDGLTTNNVADALTSYWVLNWVAANGAYAVEVDSRPIQRQLRQAFANDPNFLTLSDQQRQEMAEGYILNFLVEHAALNNALAQQDIEALYTLAMASVSRFHDQMKVNLLDLVPGPNGFQGRPQDD
ncbi:hypothetical protein GGR20_000629 [Devosia subaequoris]|uniref:Uncharacterized protein n=1 Tax=Devosia subaequoris TaxID=395930 RepID=A0A7W6NAT7_9HYPH|nr:DUF6683 family protein [Devosia subaequoris]MBB4051011.1 hypothetical protein [Devosia subaequoris]MCP1208321.1 hypothetical protein [Devosia subaequoris]